MGMYLFETVKQMAFNVSFVILIVFCCRGILGRMPKVYSYVLWLLVALRLLCPVMLPSDISIFGLLGQVNTTEAQESEPVVSHTAADTAALKSAETEKAAESSSETLQQLTLVKKERENQLLFYGWLSGMAAFAAYGFAANLILREKLRYATKLEKEVYESDAIKAPFVYGMMKPRIYLPYRLTEMEREYILAHERYHIRRKDYLVKALAFLLLCVYWFHPLVWLSYYLMNRDMEISCDEAVMRGKSGTDRENYAALLLSFATGKKEKLFAPISFGENSTKQRVQHILREKRNVFAGGFLAAGVIVFAAVICLTDARISPETADNGVAASKEAQLLFEKRNPYVGDASANGALLIAIDKVCGMEFGEDFYLTTELQTDEEPYTFIMHLAPAGGQKYLTLSETEENNIWKRAVLFLALTENCGEVRWDYETEEGLLTGYISTDAVPLEEGVADVKAYGKSPEMLDKLLARLDVETAGQEVLTGGKEETSGDISLRIKEIEEQQKMLEKEMTEVEQHKLLEEEMAEQEQPELLEKEMAEAERLRAEETRLKIEELEQQLADMKRQQAELEQERKNLEAQAENASKENAANQ